MVARSKTAARKIVLVVDDDEQVRKSLDKVLRAEQYEVQTAAEIHEALEKFRSNEIDLVLLDLNLPFASGWDVFERITALNPLVPIIVITGRQNQSELAQAAGICAWMEKPLNVPVLMQTAAKLLAEEPTARLKRLVGRRKDFRYTPPLHASRKLL